VSQIQHLHPERRRPLLWRIVACELGADVAGDADAPGSQVGDEPGGVGSGTAAVTRGMAHWLERERLLMMGLVVGGSIKGSNFSLGVTTLD
jgi:hypothetical protein